VKYRKKQEKWLLQQILIVRDNWLSAEAEKELKLPAKE
jgi:hypothetical protein